MSYPTTEKELEEQMTFKSPFSQWLWYVYPTHHAVSFTLVAKEHIKQLRKKFTVHEVEELTFLDIQPYSSPFVMIHPLIYVCSRDYTKFAWRRTQYRKVIGVEVADSDRLSDEAIGYTNLCDAIIVPSTWSRDAYVRSGCVAPVHVVPHGLKECFLRPKRDPIKPEFNFLKKLKEDKGYIYALYFLWHSGRRKGAHLVYRIINEVQKARENVVLVLKASSLSVDASFAFDKEKTVLITGWLDDEELVDLYDLCDIYLLFSLGGGFELNGLEALSRGEIVLGAEEGSWRDYLPDEFTLPVARRVKVFENNPFHIGMGPEIDIQKAIDKILNIVDNIDKWKERASKVSAEIRKKWTWDNAGEKLINVVEQYY